MKQLEPDVIEQDILERISSNKIVLPGLPDIAVRVRQAIQHDDISTADIARVIQTDIPLTARLVQIANSPLYSGVTPVDNCNQAVSRLGLNVTRNLVTSFALRRVFSAKDSLTHQRMATLWKHSVKVAALAFTLSRITPGLDQERAMLAGLVHDIGNLPLLAYCAIEPELLRHPSVYTELESRLRGRLGMHILKSWRFEDEFVAVANEAENWLRVGGEKPDYVDVILIAQVHADFGEHRLKNVPELARLPAFPKFPIFKFGADASTELLHEAQDEIAELYQLLVGGAAAA